MEKNTSSLDEYYEALSRLKSGKPINVPKSTRITNDAVSLEAGRGKGSIKKSRSIFQDLIIAIKEAADEQIRPQNQQKLQLERTKEKAERYRRELEAALAREVSLLHELYETKKKLAELTDSKIIPIRGASEK